MNETKDKITLACDAATAHYIAATAMLLARVEELIQRRTLKHHSTMNESDCLAVKSAMSLCIARLGVFRTNNTTDDAVVSTMSATNASLALSDAICTLDKILEKTRAFDAEQTTARTAGRR